MTYEINIKEDRVNWTTPDKTEMSVMYSLSVCADCDRVTTNCPRLRGEQGDLIFKSALLTGTCAWFFKEAK